MNRAKLLNGIRHAAALLATGVSIGFVGAALAGPPGDVTVTVKSPTSTGPNITVGWRWVLEEDRTYAADPAALPARDPANLSKTQASNLYRSYMPVVNSGHAVGAVAIIQVPDVDKRYVISVLPDQSTPADGPRDCQAKGNCFTMSGKQILPHQINVVVAVAPQPVPTAQIFLRAFEDTRPLNNVWDDTETGLGGFTVFVYDMAGQMSTDTFGNPLGTVYDGLNVDGTPHVKQLGDGTLHTMTAAEVNDPNKNPYGLVVGEALIKNLAPGKYGTRIVPPTGQGWQQTSTIEGTPGLDNWVKANEPRYFAEFGPAGHHSEYGFVKDATKPALSAGHYPVRNGPGVISGTVRNQRMARPSDSANSPLGFSAGHRIPGCWVGLNTAAGVAVYAGPCSNEEGQIGDFEITGLQPGTYQLVVFDKYLELIFNMVSVDVGVNGEALQRTGLTVSTFRWFQSHEHWVFSDTNGNGIRDPGEAGIPDQVINLRYRDGSIYQSSTTDTTGYLPFDEVFPFFSWLIAEVDYARFKPTGVTVGVDNGGPVQGAETDGAIPSIDRPGNVGHGHFNPQLQNPDEATPGSNGQTRTETGPVLLEGYNAFIGTTNVFEWGKLPWPKGENGGITGVVYYQTTRAENDPRFAAPETWEPGVPRVQVALYRGDAVGRIYEKRGDGTRGVLRTDATVRLADIDNFPFCWSDLDAAIDVNLCPSGALRGDEDLDRDSNGQFDMGDALEVTHTDSFDDNPPMNCPGDPADSFHMQPPGEAATPYNGRCYDGLRNHVQVRPALFDGGYAFGKPFTDLALTPGNYVVQASPPTNYEIQKEEDKNVDFGDAMTLSPQALPPLCVGTVRTVPDSLTLFPGVDTEFAGQDRPLCDRKLVIVADGKNAAADFFVFTDVPVTGHIQGFVLNDLANEFDPRSPNFGEKFAPSFIPVSVRDFVGNEVYHTTTDAWGTYNAIVPSAFRINTPMPSGVSPNMLQICLNSPLMDSPAFNPGVAESNTNRRMIADPNFNKKYTQFCYTLNFQPGQTTFLDTPVLPIAAFASPGSAQCDCEYPSGTPVIHSAVSNTYNGPVVLPTGGSLTITSRGSVMVPDPAATPIDGDNTVLVSRDYSFGSSGTVRLNGVTLAGVTWGASAISVPIPAGSRTGLLEITRTDGATPVKSVHSITLIVASAANVHEVQPGGSIQAVIDAATTKPGDAVVVPTGNWQEMLVMTKPIQLQGAGAASTILNPVQSPTEKLAEWRKKVNYLVNCTRQIGLLENQPNNTPSNQGQCGFLPGTGLFGGIEGPGVLVAPAVNVFGGVAARIDGFTITGADQSAAVVVNGNATGLEISNNVIANNQGPAAAGIRVGHPTLLDANEEQVNANNANLDIHHNHIQQNGGTLEPGAGIGLYTGAANYRVTNNYICGNFAQMDGGGIAHYGRSPGGLIADNKILFNQTFDQTALAGGSGGGILVAGHEPQVGAALALTAGSGSVQILRNLIQGNNAGSGEGGGIMLRFINGQDSENVGIGNGNTQPATIRRNFESVQVLSNIIVNNVAGFMGGGVSMQDAVNAVLINNTIVNNDTTATAAAALSPNSNNSVGPQPAGVVSHAHSAALLAAAAARLNGSNDRFEQAVGRYSIAELTNDIIIGNRSLVWTITGTFGSTGQNYGGIAPPAAGPQFWDLAVVGVPGVAPTLATSNSILTAVAEVIGGQPNCAVIGNICSSAALSSEDTILVRPYRHGVVGGDNLPGGEFPIQAAAALDEGGNFIDVHYGPLTESAGNYHIETAGVAVNSGGNPASYPASMTDVDNERRPSDVVGTAANNFRYDIGADEVQLGAIGTAGNNAPSIISPTAGGGGGGGGGTANAVAYVGRQFSLQVVAIDPNGDLLTYALTNATGGGIFPTGATISASGTISWTPTAITPSCTGAGGNAARTRVRATATDGKIATPVGINICIQVQSANAPTAIADAYIVLTNGSFTQAPRGVLINDTVTGANANTLTAILESDLVVGGSVALQSDGGFTFAPKLGWVGSDAFTYRAVNTAGVPSADPATTVTLTRNLAVIDARFQNGVWTLRGFSATPLPSGVVVRRSRTNNCSNNTNCPQIPGSFAPSNPLEAAAPYAWTFTSSSNPGWQAGDTLRLFAGNGFNNTLRLQDVQVGSFDASTMPQSTAYTQCPADTNKDGIVTPAEQATHPGVVCKHLAAGDGFLKTADGKELYTFGFNDVTNQPLNLAISKGILNAQFPAPTLVFDEGDEVYLTLTNAGMLKRPDLFDSHSVHFHGFPNAATVFDGVPESGISVNMGFSLTYYYKIVEAGTFMYHCHVEAAEHMQMGMLGNLYIRPRQNKLAAGSLLGGYVHQAGNQYVYNDGDGSTRYDVELPLQIGSMDSNFHEQHIGVQPLPFANMRDDYAMLNGRGYPQTVDTTATGIAVAVDGEKATSGVMSAEESSQKLHSLVEARAGQRILLRISNLNITRFYTLGATGGLTMKMIGTGGHILRGPDGTNLFYDTAAVTLGGGESADVIIDTTGVAPGTYVLYSKNLEALSNGDDASVLGGMMTEIRIAP
jgi:large repetitive protein